MYFLLSIVNPPPSTAKSGSNFGYQSQVGNMGHAALGPGAELSDRRLLTVSSHFSRCHLTRKAYTIAQVMSRHRLIGVLAVVLCIPAATIAWLGFRLIEQDRALGSQRVAEGREQAANKAVQTLSALLSDPGLLARH